MLILIAALGCEREKRLFNAPPPPIATVRSGASFAPGPDAKNSPQQPSALESPYTEDNAWAVTQGKRLFRWYNCNGCHAGGGGGMGPALMDAHWLYGAAPEQIAASIRDGRPNGMPAFAGRIPQDQLWQLVAYVRSMSGQLRTDVAPGRSDSLSTGGEPEQRREREEPKGP